MNLTVKVYTVLGIMKNKLEMAHKKRILLDV